jgi:hypothetical protein
MGFFDDGLRASWTMALKIVVGKYDPEMALEWRWN